EGVVLRGHDDDRGGGATRLDRTCDFVAVGGHRRVGEDVAGLKGGALGDGVVAGGNDENLNVLRRKGHFEYLSHRCAVIGCENFECHGASSRVEFQRLAYTLATARVKIRNG